MRAPSYGQYWPITARRWDNVTTTRESEARTEAAFLYANKPRYQGLVARFAQVHPGSEVPWWWPACASMRESGARFDRQLAQGDPLNEVSTNDPAGQGPYYGPDAWERAGIVAMEAKKLQDIHDWRLEKALFWWETFNGWGYWEMGLPSAYIWSGTSVYDPPTGPGGKYIRDHVFDKHETDEQIGCAAILRELMKLDPTINPERETPPGVADEPKPSPAPPAPTPTETTVTQVPIPVLAPQALHLDLDQIEKGIVALAGVAASPWLAPLIPAQARPFLAILPIAEEVIEALKQWQAGTHDATAAAGILSELMADISRELQAVKTALAKS